MTKDKDSQDQRKIWGLSIPIMIEFFVGFSIPATDSFFLSKISLEAALAVGAVIPIIIFFDIFFGALNTSAKSLASQALGKGDPELAKKIFNYTLWMVLKVGIVLFLFIFFGRGILVSILGLEGETAAMASSYLLVMGCGLSILGARFLFQVMNAVYGIVHYNIISAVIMLTTNVIGNYAVINDFLGLRSTGVVGIAVVSIFSVFFAILFLVFIQKCKLGFSLKFVKLHSDYWNVLKTSSKIAIPSALDPVSVQLFAVFATAIIARLGEFELAARVFAGNIFQLAFVPGLAMMITSQILTSQSLGARNFDAATKIVHRIFRYTLILCAFLVVPLVIFSESIVSIFTDNAEVLSYAKGVFFILALTELVRVVNLIIGSNLKSSGDGYVPVGVAFITTWVIAAPLLFFFGKTYGLYLVFLILLLDEVLKAIFNAYRWFQNKWKVDLVGELT